MARKRMTYKFMDGSHVEDDMKWLIHATPDQIVSKFHAEEKNVTVQADFGLSVIVKVDGKVVATGQSVQGALASAYRATHRSKA